MDWKDIAGIVGRTAPILGTLVAGPAGAAIGGIIGSILGTGNSPDAIHAAIATDPTAALKLAEYETENRTRLQEMAYADADSLRKERIALVASDVEDRKSARQREVDSKDTITPRVLAVLITLGAMGCAWAIFSGNFTQTVAAAGLVGAVVGYVFNEFKQVTTYYFGSSAGSDRKTEIMAKTTPAIEPNASGAV